MRPYDLNGFNLIFIWLATKCSFVLLIEPISLAMSGGGVPTKCCSYGGSQIPHCAKSCRPFELFANENHKLRMNQNEMQHLREVRLKIHRHNPLFFEMNDASA